MRRIVSVLLVFISVFALGVTAFAVTAYPSPVNLLGANMTAYADMRLEKSLDKDTESTDTEFVATPLVQTWTSFLNRSRLYFPSA